MTDSPPYHPQRHDPGGDLWLTALHTTQTDLILEGIYDWQPTIPPKQTWSWRGSMTDSPPYHPHRHDPGGDLWLTALHTTHTDMILEGIYDWQPSIPPTQTWSWRGSMTDSPPYHSQRHDPGGDLWLTAHHTTHTDMILEGIYDWQPSIPPTQTWSWRGSMTDSPPYHPHRYDPGVDLCLTALHTTHTDMILGWISAWQPIIQPTETWSRRRCMPDIQVF